RRARRAERLADRPLRRVQRAGAQVRAAFPQGPLAPGCARVWKEPHRQGDRVAVGAAFVAPRSGADFFQLDRLLRGKSETRDPRGGERFAGDPVDRRDRERPGRQLGLGGHRQRRICSGFWLLADLAAGEDRAGGGVSHLLDHGRGDFPGARVVEEPDPAGLGGAAAGGGAFVTGRLTRFLNLERPRTAEQTPPHGVATKARFEGAEPEIGLEFDMGEQPFLRCPACEADNGKHAEKCFNCGRPLQTEDVRAWNAVFWQARQAQKAVQMLPAPPPLNEETRKLAELLALQVAEREKVRMWWCKDEQPYDSTPAAFRLLGLIKDANTRFM